MCAHRAPQCEYSICDGVVFSPKKKPPSSGFKLIFRNVLPTVRRRRFTRVRTTTPITTHNPSSLLGPPRSYLCSLQQYNIIIDHHDEPRPIHPPAFGLPYDARRKYIFIRSTSSLHHMYCIHNITDF